MFTRHWQRFSLLATFALAVTSGGALTLIVPIPVLAHEADGHPARIHEGSCDAIGRVTDRLTGVDAEINLEGTPIPPPEVVGSETAIPIDVSVTALETKMADLIDTPHAIVVYESDEAMEQMLVCGNIGGALVMQMPGMAMPGDELVIWLGPQGDSASTGVALLRSESGGTSSVSLVLAEGLAGEAGTTEDHGHADAPAATPVSG